MSKEALSSFLKLVAENENLQHKLIEFAASQGFEFTADELSDADLDGVAGGSTSAIFDGKVNKSGSLFPDVTNTPPAGSATPIPYPNDGDDGVVGEIPNISGTIPGVPPKS